MYSKSSRKPVILVTNDDGINAKGIKALAEMAKQFGRVVVVAPDEGNSGMSHAITIKHPLRLKKHNWGDDIEAYSVNGTPVDCVKLAINQVFKHKPDMLLSGINHGSNSSVSVFYSGTMAAAIEGCLYDIPSIGFSLLDYMSDADFSGAIKFGKQIIQNVLDNGIRNGVCLNVNVPAIPKDEIKGIKICRQNMGTWREEFDKRTDPRGTDYFWLTGYFQNDEPQAIDTDEYALSNGYVSIVPVSIDLTDKIEHARLSGLFNNLDFSTKQSADKKQH
ncbi:MAG: 5'/3'-nucleotidase SurE [Tenuifilaceae bacterium]|nr:5'/3'-nucleotidase SurE [Tenuifilaceae bacterium]